MPKKAPAVRVIGVKAAIAAPLAEAKYSTRREQNPENSVKLMLFIALPEEKKMYNAKKMQIMQKILNIFPPIKKLVYVLLFNILSFLACLIK